MKLLIIEPGASYSTIDVSNGYIRAFEAAGVEVVRFALDQRIAYAGAWLHYLWRKAQREGVEKPRPSPGDVQLYAGYDSLFRALWFGVDGVLIITGMYVLPDLIVMMRRAGIRTGIIFTESPYDDAMQLRLSPYVDVCFTNERSTLPAYQAVNSETYYLPHAYDPGQIEAAARETDVPAHDVVFVGTGFQERIDLLSAIDWTGIDFGLYGHWDMLGSRHRLRKYLCGGVQDNARTIALYQHAKIGLNLYRESMGFGRDAPKVQGAESLNPRAYELAAAGCFQVSSRRAEADELFGPGVWHYDTGDSGDSGDLAAAIDAALSVPLSRRILAASASEAVQPHTYANRAAFVIERLEEVWRGRAPPDTASEEGTSGDGNVALSVVR